MIFPVKRIMIIKEQSNDLSLIITSINLNKFIFTNKLKIYGLHLLKPFFSNVLIYILWI